MARDFDGSTDIINFGSPSALDDLSPFTWVAWIAPDTAGESSQGHVLAKGASIKILATDNVNVTNGLLFYVDRGGGATPAYALSVDNALTFSAWRVIFCTFDETDGCRIYLAAPGSAPSEISYTARPVGSGTVTSDAADDLGVGGSPAEASVNYDGRIAEVAVYDRVLNANEMAALARGMPAHKLPGGQVLYAPIWGRHSAEPDFGPNHLAAGTVTGASFANHAPLRQSSRLPASLIVAGSALVRVVSETTQVSEGSLRLLGLRRVHSEVLQLAESSVRALGLVRVFDESVQIAEAFSRIVGIRRVISETAQFAEGVLKFLGRSRVADETVDLQENTARTIGIIQAVSETVGFAEAAVRSLGLVRAVNESVSMQEDVRRSLGIVRVFSETVQFMESTIYARGIKRVIDEAVSWGESVIHFVGSTQVFETAVQFFVRVRPAVLSLFGVKPAVDEAARVKPATDSDVSVTPAVSDDADVKPSVDYTTGIKK